MCDFQTLEKQMNVSDIGTKCSKMIESQELLCLPVALHVHRACMCRQEMKQTQNNGADIENRTRWVQVASSVSALFSITQSI